MALRVGRAIPPGLSLKSVKMSGTSVLPSPIRSDGGKAYRIAVVGDVHYHWVEDNEIKALKHLNPDLLLFVGDFGNEAVDIVASVKNVPFPKAVILGNHDAWNHKNVSPSIDDKVQQQIDILGDDHVGYSRKDFPELQLSVVGSRPFSWGGSHWHKNSGLRYNVHNFKSSAQKIIAAAMAAPPSHSLIFLGHNGPTGLGSSPEDICGRDWPLPKGKPGAGDHGDIDLALAVAEVIESGRKVLAVIFGHMHHTLIGSTLENPAYRKMIVKEETSGVYFINSAVVPRHEDVSVIDPMAASGAAHHFTLIGIEDSVVKVVDDVWVAIPHTEDSSPFVLQSLSRIGN